MKTWRELMALIVGFILGLIFWGDFTVAFCISFLTVCAFNLLFGDV
tara:strand:+ start:345 stop:482 length:138 start_codon:yes stop_codon:yes gene_type:complete